MYQVEWEAPALDALADICLVHRQRWADINGAVDITEYHLQRDPVAQSRHLAEGLRRIECSPLAIVFSISGPTVTIESVRWIG